MLTWIKAAVNFWAALKGFFTLAGTVFTLIVAYYDRKRRDAENKRIQDAASRIIEAEKIENDEQRIEELANATCELEKLSNPDSDCGGGGKS